MKVKCPHCGAIGRVPSEKVPAKGANIRCTACRTVFRIGGPENENVVRSALESTQMPAMNRTQSLPSMSDAKASALAATRRSPDSQPAEPPTADNPAASESAHAGNLDDDLAAALAAAASSVDDGPTEPTSKPEPAPEPSRPASTSPALLDVGLEAVEPAKPAGPKTWKVKSESGIVYDFPDTEAVRKWLKGRSSHDGMLFSDDGGASYRPASEVPEISDVQPSAARVSVAKKAVVPEARTTTHSGLHRVTTNSGAFKLTDVEGGDSGGAAPLVVEEERPFTSPTPASRPTQTKPAGETRARRRQRAKDEKRQARERAKREKEKAARDTSRGKSSGGRQTTDNTWKYIAALIFVALGAVFYYSVLPGENNGIPLPNTPAGEQMEWMIELMQGGTEDLDALTNADLETRLSPVLLGSGDDIVGVFRSELERWDALYFRWIVTEIYENEDTVLGVWIENEFGHEGKVEIEVDATAPHQIVRLEVLPPRDYVQ